MFWKSQYGTKCRGYNTIRIMRSLVQKGLIGILQEVLVAHVKVITIITLYCVRVMLVSAVCNWPYVHRYTLLVRVYILYMHVGITSFGMWLGHTILLCATWATTVTTGQYQPWGDFVGRSGAIWRCVCVRHQVFPFSLWPQLTLLSVWKCMCVPISSPGIIIVSTGMWNMAL